MHNSRRILFLSTLLCIILMHHASNITMLNEKDFFETKEQNITALKKTHPNKEALENLKTQESIKLSLKLLLTASIATAIIYKATREYSNNEPKTKIARLQQRGNLTSLCDNAFQLTNLETRAGYGPRITIAQGDITHQQFANYQRAAIVNAANEQLAHGAGIARAIDLAAGPELGNYQRNNNLSCPTGQACITPAFNLANNHVCAKIIHTVGPIGVHPDQLHNAYINSLRLAEQQGITAIAFPAISTGIFGYPLAAATQVALDAVISYIQNTPNTQLQEIRFVAYDASNFETYRQITHQFLIP